MRIVLLHDDFPASGGGAAVIVDQFRRALSDRGHEVTLITSHTDAAKGQRTETKDGGGRIISLHIAYPLQERHRRCIRMGDVSRRLTEIFAELRPRIVHAHNIHTYLTYDALRLARAAGAKVFLTAHDTFLVSFHRVNTEKYRNAVMEKIPYHMHWWDHMLAVGRRYWPLRSRAIRAILKQSRTRVIAISHATARFLRTHGIHPAHVIPNGIPVPHTHPHQTDGKTILFCARINEDKGLGALISALPMIPREQPDAKLLIVGEETRAAPFLKNLPPAERSHVHLTGSVTREQIPGIYASADVVTVPSLYLDNFPTVALEAMAAHKPVVGTIFGGMPEIVEDDITGLLCNPTDPRSLATAILALLGDPKRAHEMGKRGRERFERHFTMKRMVEDYCTLFAK